MSAKIYTHTEGTEKTAVLIEDCGFTFIQRDTEDLSKVFSDAEDAIHLLEFLQGTEPAANVFSEQGEIKLRRTDHVTVSQFDDIDMAWSRVVLTNEQAEAIAQAMATAMGA